MKQDTMLDFVKSRLEENEGISAAALARLLVAAEKQPPIRRAPVTFRRPAVRAFLVAASLAAVVGGWFLYAETANARRERNLADVMELLRMVDGDEAASSSSMTENLLAWQDAPMLAGASDSDVAPFDE